MSLTRREPSASFSRRSCGHAPEYRTDAYTHAPTRGGSDAPRHLCLEHSRCQCLRLRACSYHYRGSQTFIGCFQGRVLTKRIVLGWSDGWALPIEEYTFGVERAWKGVSSAQVLLREGTDDCDKRFAVGTSYLVFATPDKPNTQALTSLACLPTKPSSESVQEYAALGNSRFAATRVYPSIARPASFSVRLFFVDGPPEK